MFNVLAILDSYINKSELVQYNNLDYHKLRNIINNNFNNQNTCSILYINEV